MGGSFRNWERFLRIGKNLKNFEFVCYNLKGFYVLGRIFRIWEEVLVIEKEFYELEGSFRNWQGFYFDLGREEVLGIDMELQEFVRNCVV